MIDRPTGAELLAEARRLLLADLLERLPPEHRYEARMIANAMAIAARELEAGDAPARALWQDLALLYGEPSEPAPIGAELDKKVAALARRLAADIRHGAFDADDPRRQAVQDLLRKSTLARLRISNPKALPSSPGG